jgi:RimJ/RimL family protein N-acetyltransferase
MQKEAQVRQVRYWQNRYWDSVKYGILREEWEHQQ